MLSILLIAFILVQSYNTEELFIIEDEEIAMSGTVGVTPQMFGAKGDGVSNDTKPIQSAIDFASKNGVSIVFIPEGTYLVRNLRLKANVTLVGEGENSILKADPSCQTWDGILYCEKLNTVLINNITFDGNKPVVPGDPQKGTVNLWVNDSQNVEIKNCSFQNNFYLGICIKRSNTISISNCKFINLDCGIITSSYPSSNITITNNYFDGAEYSEPISIFGLNEGYHENITITNNIIKNHTKGSGILVRAAKTVFISDNTIDNCGTGIYLASAEYNGVLYGVYDAIVENNTIKNTIFEGILINGSINSIVAGNKIENAGSYGLLTKKANNNIISNNALINKDISYLTYDGFAMTLSGLSSSQVNNNTIIISENMKLDKNRKPITISANSTDNTFTNNNVSVGFNEVYKVVSKRNTFN